MPRSSGRVARPTNPSAARLRRAERAPGARDPLRVPTGLLAVGLALLAVACQAGDPGTAGCQIAQQVVVPSSPLALLPHARLDQASSTLALTGVDADGATARWALFDATAGALGAERSLALPVGDAGPWLALTSEKAPGDTVLVVVAVVAANGADAELHVVTAPASVSTTTAPPLGPALAVVPGAFGAGGTPTVALGASRSGPHAVLAWIAPDPSPVPTKTTVNELVLSAAGEPIGAPTVIDTAPAFACLGFGPGKSALTLVYHSYADATTNVPTYVITELRDAGDVDATLALILEGHAAGCPQLSPTAGGYAIAFQDVEASWLGVYDASTNGLALNAFAAAVAFGGPALQPPLVGLAPMGTDFATVLERIYGGELWRLSSGGAHRSGRLAFPSMVGTIGDISTQSNSGSVTATYADYTSLDGGVGTAGQRYFLRLTCQ